MTAIGRRSFLLRTGGAGLGLAVSGSMASVLGTAGPAGASARIPASAVGFGPLGEDARGVLDLPRGFAYRAFSRESVDRLDGGQRVPSGHDGMAAFRGDGGATVLVRNHELNAEDVAEESLTAVPRVQASHYDPNGAGGTTTLEVDAQGRLVRHVASLSGTVDNCAGGPTPWGTWLTCEETDDVIDGLAHGYVFEVDPRRGGNPAPITALGRFEHEAVAFDPRTGVAYLTEDADTPLGYFYRFRPGRPFGGRGSLHAGGALSAMAVPELGGADLSAVSDTGRVLAVEWVPVPQPDVAEGETIREQVRATEVSKCEGAWADRGCVWFVSSRGDGPDAEDEGERSDRVHGGQIWCHDPGAATLRLVVEFEPTSPFEGPDNITVSPHGYVVMCTDGEDDQQFLAGITPAGEVFPIAYNRLSDDEFAGACFSADGRTLFVNIQSPGHTFAIWGPWESAT